MESAGCSWRDELKKYFRSVEALTEKALSLIKRDRIQNHLPFDESFKEYFLDRTHSRVANSYTNFLYEERLEEEMNQQNNRNGRTLNQQQLTSTTVSTESIAQMPIILVQSNDLNLAPSTSTRAPFLQKSSQMSDQIIISIPSNQLQSAPLQSENHQCLDQQPNAQRPESIALKDEPIEKSESMVESMIERDLNKDSRKIAAVASGKAMASTSNSAHRLDHKEPFKQMVNPKPYQRPETIDLTSDQKDAAATMGSAHSDGQTSSNVRQRKAFESSAAVNSKQTEKFNTFLHGGKQLQTKCRVDQPSKRSASVPKNLKSSSDHSAHDVVIDHEEQRRHVNIQPFGKKESSCSQPSNTNALMLDEPEFVTQNIRGATYEVDARPSRLMIQQKDTKSDKSNVNVHAGKNPKPSGVEEAMKRRHKCDFCEYSADCKSHLIKHIRTHTGERPYECEVCGKRFTQKQHLNRHKKIHRDLFQFQCSNCRQGFSNGQKWKTHESRCKAKGYECHLCKKIYLSKHVLVDHMRTHTAEKLRCLKCPKQFSSISGLTRHMKSHGNLFRFQCSNCRQGFSHKAQWKLHESRCKSKQYECFLCSKKFHQERGHLLWHMRRKHTGEKPFGCSDCPKRFCHKSELTRHTKRYHLNGK